MGIFPLYNIRSETKDSESKLTRLRNSLWPCIVVTIVVSSFIYRLAKAILEEYNHVERVIWVPDIIASSMTYLSAIMCIIIGSASQSITLDSFLLKYSAFEKHFYTASEGYCKYIKLRRALVRTLVLAVLCRLCGSLCLEVILLFVYYFWPKLLLYNALYNSCELYILRSSHVRTF